MKPGLALASILLIAVALAAAACGANATSPADQLPSTPVVATERVSSAESGVGSQWGQMARWRIEDAEWSIVLPEDGQWDSNEPLNQADFSPDTATYRNSVALGRASGASVFVDVVRIDLATVQQDGCVRPIMMSPDGGFISMAFEDMSIDGHTAMVTRITTPAADGSTTGTFEVCLVTGGSIYQLVAAARPASAQADMFTMIGSFRLDN